MIESRASNSLPAPKLNILALPRLTTVLLALMLGTILGSVGLALFPGSQVRWIPIVIGFAMLSMRDFLGAPDRWMRKHKATERADEDTLNIENAFLSLSPDPSIFVAVVTTDGDMSSSVTGTIRRHFWGLGQRMARRIAASLSSSNKQKQKMAQALLAQTLGYFLNGDARLIELAVSFLRTQLLTGVVYACAGLILIAFLGRFGPEILSQEFWSSLSAGLSSPLPRLALPDLGSILQSLTKQNPAAAAQLADPTLATAFSTKAAYSLIDAILPVFLCVLVLYGAHFTQLVRGAVLYADARAAMLMGDARAIVEMMDFSLIWSLSSPGPGGFRQGIELVRERIDKFIIDAPLAILGRPWALKHGERILCLERPELAIGSAKSVAIAAGLSALVLELVQRGVQGTWFGTPSQGIAPFIYYVPTYIIFAIWLTPQLIQRSGRSLLRTIAELIVVFMTVRLVPNLVDLLVAGIYILGNLSQSGAPFVERLFRAMFGSGAVPPLTLPVLGTSGSGYLNQHVIRPFLYSVLVMAPVLFAFLSIEARLSQYVLTWYRQEQRTLKVFYGLNAMFTVMLALVIIPLSNWLVYPEAHPVWSATEIGGLIVAFVALVSGSVVFWFIGRRLARFCPRCAVDIPGQYYLGRECSACGQQLHSWLIASY